MPKHDNYGCFLSLFVIDPLTDFIFIFGTVKGYKRGLVYVKYIASVPKYVNYGFFHLIVTSFYPN